MPICFLREIIMPIQIRLKDSPEYTSKLNWVKGLKVGDVIRDCRQRHVRISRIETDSIVPIAEWVRAILYASWLPFFIGNLLDYLYCWAAHKLGKVEVVDRSLVLEDGAYCSAMNCCDPPHNL
jgi:hypothetical protein